MAEGQRPEGLPVPPPHYGPSTDHEDPEKVAASQKQFPWKIADWNDPANPWVTWPALGLNVKEEFGRIEWKELADQEHMFTGVAKLWPGGYEPEHIHDTPMAYYIIEGNPVVILNGVRTQTRAGQCVSIPGRCPHAIDNPKDAPIATWIWCYVHPTVKVNKHHLNWEWKEEVEEK